MTALLRRLVQAVVPAVLAYGPVSEVADWLGWNITPAQAVTFVLGVVLAVYTTVGDWLQKQPIVQSNPTLRFVVGLLMGGTSTPTYD